jgi:hypothetical protein
MDLHTKITLTLVINMAVAWCLIFPSSPIADYLKNKLGSYENVMVVALAYGLTPLVIDLLVWIWACN